MTVGELRKALAFLPADMPVVREEADHTLVETIYLSSHTAGYDPDIHQYCMYGRYDRFRVTVEVAIIE